MIFMVVFLLVGMSQTMVFAEGNRFGLDDGMTKRVADTDKISKLPFIEAWAADLRRMDDSGNPIPNTGNIEGQPIIIDEEMAIYVQAGQDFLRLNYDQATKENPPEITRIDNISGHKTASTSTPTYVQTKYGPRIYQATRDHRLLAIDPSMDRVYWEQTLAAGSRPDLLYRITASPFVQDINGRTYISIGSATGDLSSNSSQYYADNGYFALEDKGSSADILKSKRMTGEVTGSHLLVNDKLFGTVNSLNAKSKFIEYSIANNEISSPLGVQFDAGVPTSPALEDGYMYVVDRQGRLYKIDTNVMKATWINESNIGNSLVLEDPTIGDKYVFAAIKHYKSQSTGGNGAVVVHDKQDGHVVKVIKLNSPLQNHVLYWKPKANEPGYLIVYESNGTLQFIQEDSWKPVKWFQDDKGQLQTSPKISDTGKQYTSPQIIMHDNLLLVVDGVGIMHAFKAQRPVDLAVTDIRLLDKELEDVHVGDTVTIEATLANYSDNDYKDVDVRFSVNDQTVEEIKVDLAHRSPNENFDNKVRFSMVVQSTLPMFTVEVNPNRDNPNDEIDWNNNKKTLFAPIDLAVTDILLSKKFISQEDPMVTATVKTKAQAIDEKFDQEVTIRTKVRLMTVMQTIEQDVELQLNSSKDVVFPLDFTGLDFDKVNEAGIIATINPDFEIYEPLEPKEYRDNNTKKVMISVNQDYDLIALSIDSKDNVKVNDKVSVNAKVLNNSRIRQDNVLIRFSANKKTVYETRVNFGAGETKDIGFVWTAPSEPGAVDMIVHVDPNNEALDSNRSNNVKNKLINVNKRDSKDNDTPNNRCDNWDVSYPVITGYHTKTVTSTWKDADGKVHTESYEVTDYGNPIWETRTVNYTECIDATAKLNTKQGIATDPSNPQASDHESRGSWEIIPWAQKNGYDPNEVTRAGYGFEIKVNTKYTTDWETKVPTGFYEGTAKPLGGSYSGPTMVQAYIYNTNGEYVTSYNLEKTSGNDTSGTWELPIREYRTALGDVIRDRKFYTDVEAPDGQYKIIIVARNAGKMGVNASLTKTIRIYGSMYDDIQNVREK